MTNIASPSTVGLGYYEPKGHNNIPTPPIAVDLLPAVLKSMKLGTLKNARVWEPAVGEGHLAKRLEYWGAKVKGTELRTGPDVYGTGGRTFESYKKPPGTFDLIITNPPFGSLLRTFLAQACTMSHHAPVVLLFAQHTLMKIWLAEMMRDYLHGFYPIVFGLPYLKGGRWVTGGAFKHAWTVWRPDAPCEPRCRFLIKTDAS